MSDTETFSRDDVRDMLRRALTDAGMSYAEWLEAGKDCAIQCGCALYKVSDDLAWLYKNRSTFDIADDI